MPINTDNDRLAKTLRFRKIRQEPDFAQAQAAADDEFLNGINLAHGGFLYSLCDYTLALAANTGERAAISSSGAIEYIKPVPPQTRVLAECKKLSGSAKSGYYETTVFNEDKTEIFCIFHARAIYKPV